MVRVVSRLQRDQQQHGSQPSSRDAVTRGWTLRAETIRQIVTLFLGLGLLYYNWTFRSDAAGIHRALPHQRATAEQRESFFQFVSHRLGGRDDHPDQQRHVYTTAAQRDALPSRDETDVRQSNVGDMERGTEVGVDIAVQAEHPTSVTAETEAGQYARAGADALALHEEEVPSEEADADGHLQAALASEPDVSGRVQGSPEGGDVAGEEAAWARARVEALAGQPWDPKHVRYGLLAACTVRSEEEQRRLLEALDSWRQLRGLSELVLVDWGSPHPIAEAVEAVKMGNHRTHFKFIRVQPKDVKMDYKPKDMKKPAPPPDKAPDKTKGKIDRPHTSHSRRLLTSMPPAAHLPYQRAHTASPYGHHNRTISTTSTHHRRLLATSSGKAKGLSWHLAAAYNFALRHTAAPVVLKVDCDTKLNADFLGVNVVEGATHFRSGHAVPEAPPKYSHSAPLRGVLLAPTALLRAVHGYNEHIRSYGGEAAELYARLEAAGAVHTELSLAGMAEHLPHPHHAPLGWLGSQVSECQNQRVFGQGQLAWGAHSPPAYKMSLVCDAKCSFAIQHRHSNGNIKNLTAAQKSTDLVSSGVPIMYTVAPEPRPADASLKVHPSQAVEAELEAAREACLGEVLVQHFDYPGEALQQLRGVRNLETLLRIENGDAATPGTLSRPLNLIIQVENGLGNRLRAWASAVAVGQDMGRQVTLVWVANEDMGAAFQELFSTRVALLSAMPDSLKLSDPWRRHFKYYTYMEWDEGYRDHDVDNFRPVIPPNPGTKDLFVRSAFKLNYASKSMPGKVMRDHMAGTLAGLALRPAVARLMASVTAGGSAPRVPVANMVGVHIRQGQDNKLEPEQQIVDEVKRKSVSSNGDEHRSKCTVDRFVKKMRTFSSDKLFYVAADDPELVRELQRKLGDIRIAYLPRPKVCSYGYGVARAQECALYAAADMFALSSTAGPLLGSAGSSFSEVANLVQRGATKRDVSMDTPCESSHCSAHRFSGHGDFNNFQFSAAVGNIVSLQSAPLIVCLPRYRASHPKAGTYAAPELFMVLHEAETTAKSQAAQDRCKKRYHGKERHECLGSKEQNGLTYLEDLRWSQADEALCDSGRQRVLVAPDLDRLEEELKVEECRQDKLKYEVMTPAQFTELMHKYSSSNPLQAMTRFKDLLGGFGAANDQPKAPRHRASSSTPRPKLL